MSNLNFDKDTLASFADGILVEDIKNYIVDNAKAFEEFKIARQANVNQKNKAKGEPKIA
ncbi:MAG: hypothetical protein IJ300_07445 [Clostridia bacterium]|nr:hypothetical protein [Clostridia bacterium]